MNELINKQSVLDVLNNLEVIEQQGGDECYILVANSEENCAELNAVGVANKDFQKYGDDETFCILAFAFGEGYCNDYKDGKLIWNPNIEEEE